jgi:glucose-1-phosphate cytidylyltransferase
MIPAALRDTRTLILCGGKGTRAYPHTVDVPKPLLEVGGRPILRHVMEIYAQQGARRFLLAGGYKIDMIRGFADSLPDEWDVNVVDTGEDANTATRIWRCRDLLTERFFATYGDGLGNIDLRMLVESHVANGGLATITTVPLPSQYGTVTTDEFGRVVEFKEKPRLFDHWINGGFMVFEPAVFAAWVGDDLEREVLPSLAASGHLYAYRHMGFWKSMDTYKDAVDLSAIAAEDPPPWMDASV